MITEERKAALRKRAREFAATVLERTASQAEACAAGVTDDEEDEYTRDALIAIARHVYAGRIG